MTVGRIDINTKLRLTPFVLLVAAVYCIVADGIDFIRQPMSNVGDVVVMIAYFGLIALMQTALIWLMALSRRVFAILFPLLTLATGVLTWFFATLNITLSPTVAGIVLENDVATSLDFITLPFIGVCVAALAAGVVAAVVRYRYVGSWSRKGSYIGAAVLVALILIVWNIPRVRAMLEVRQPFSLYSSLTGWLNMRHQAAELRPAFDNIPATCEADSMTVVFVLGESLRADHLGLNGYSRNTTPRLASTANLHSLPWVSTSSFHTSEAVPKIMTRASDANPEQAYVEPSFITLFKKAGYNTVWIANQEPMTSFTYFTEEADSIVRSYLGHSLYGYDSWTDMAMIEPLEEILADAGGNQLIVMHTIGNHWWFKAHYTPEDARWMPEMRSRNLHANTPEEILNSYDNATMATDRFLSEVISRLSSRKSIVIYLSDHGEGLGDDRGIYLHASPSKGTSQPAALIWYSDTWLKAYPDKAAAIGTNSRRELTPDFLFHTILDCGAIRTPAMDPRQSLAAPLNPPR